MHITLPIYHLSRNSYNFFNVYEKGAESIGSFGI